MEPQEQILFQQRLFHVDRLKRIQAAGKAALADVAKLEEFKAKFMSATLAYKNLEQLGQEYLELILSRQETTEAVKKQEVSKIKDFRTAADDIYWDIQVSYNMLFGNEKVSQKSNVHLPTLEIPVFDGTYENWTHYHDLFVEIVHKNDSVSNIAKFTYLLNSLREPALSIVKAIPLSSANYPIAFNELCSRYKNKRIIAQKYWSNICQLPDKVPNTASAIFRMLSVISESLAALSQLELPTDQWSFILFDLVFKKLDKGLCTRFEATREDDSFPTFDELKKFLEIQAKAMESVDLLSVKTMVDKPVVQKSSSSYQKQNFQKQNFQNAPRQGNYTFAQFAGGNTQPPQANKSACACCKGSGHSLFKCDKFKQMSVFERHTFAKTNRLCFNCLGNHAMKECSSNSTCKVCQCNHHTLLHFEQTATSREPHTSPVLPTSREALASTSTDSQLVGTVNLPVNTVPKSSTVLLSTSLIDIRDSGGRYQRFRAIVDSGSMCSILSLDCAKKLGLKIKQTHTNVQWLSDISTNKVKGATTCNITSLYNSHCTYNVDCIVLPTVCSRLPSVPLSLKSDSYIQGLKLADPFFNTPAVVDVLLGAEVHAQIMLGGIRKGEVNEPVAFETTLGWILSGKVASTSQEPIAHPVRTFSTFECELNETLKRFWELENPPSRVVESPEDRYVEDHFVSTHSRDPTGRFIVSLPFKDPPPDLGNSFEAAKNRFLRLETRLSKNEDLRKDYHAFMEGYIQNQHMTLLGEVKDVDEGHFLAHHSVVKLDSTSTRTRVVFDAAAKGSKGKSLNDVLWTGPKLQLDLSTILLAFRKYAIVFTADIKAMFLQILVCQEDRKYLKILWRFDKSKPIQIYQLNTVTFGLNCSPFLAQRTLQQLSNEGQKSFPLASKVLREGTYVDDVVYGCDTLDEGLSIQTQLLSLLASGEFELRKWSCSDPRLLNALPENLRENKIFSLDDSDSFIKVLGMQWNPDTDYFTYKVSLFEGVCTKRNILSEIARIFDPLGLLSPLTLLAKHLIQRLWVLGIGWDDKPPSEISNVWERYKAEVILLSTLKISRRIIFNEVKSREVHAFCDASSVGFASAIYLRTTFLSGEVKVSLVTAKSKVASLKKLTIPRLELCAAVLNAELIDYVLTIFKSDLADSKVYAWTDSSITLSWIRASPHQWKTFISNRVSQIQDKAPPHWWHHIPGIENPVDCASRGLLPKDLLENSTWWNGPTWLSKPKECWPLIKVSPKIADDIDMEVANPPKLTCVVIEDEHMFIRLLNKYSSFSKIQHIVAYILRFVKNIRGTDRTSGPLTMAELQGSTLAIVKEVQQQAFAEEIKLIKANKICGKPIQKLSPFLDKDGILRVGGRLRNSNIAFENKHPMLLPKRHRFTEIIIGHYHRLYCHPGPQILQSILLQQFWIFSCKRAIQHCLSRCINCFKVDPKPLCPPMGDLPSSRVNEAKAFVHTGCDCAGPFKMTLGKHRGAKTYKAYLCVFICFVTKALHLELVSDLSSVAFIAALRRFVGRRGRVSHMYSDCGTNFVGANNILQTYLQDAADQTGIQWHFNPPSSPHMGGLWERSIRSIKALLLRTIGTQVMTFEELSTLFIQIEATLNSRPLCPISASPNDLSALTPAHFLTLEPINTVPDQELTEIPSNRLSRWQLLQQMHQTFAKRWRSEYLHTLQQRSKWLVKGSSIDVGTMVLIKEDNTFPLKWALGRVLETHPGRDGVVRVASIRTVSGVFKRPLVKLCPLPGTA